MPQDFDPANLPYLQAIADDDVESVQHIGFSDMLVRQGYAEGSEKVGYTLTDKGRAALRLNQQT